MLEVKNVLKRYDDLVALDNLSLDIKKGEVFGLLGPNGSGKTTLINCILSLSKFEKGDIKIFDQPMSADRYDLKAKIGYVPQEIAVFDELSVYDNIDFFCGLYIQDRATRKQYVEDAIEFVGLNDFRKFVPKKLSGGLKRRLNLACGLAHKPELLILDEPTAGLDPGGRDEIFELIKDLHANNDMTVILSSHSMDDMAKLVNTLMVMNKGRLEIMGSPREVFKENADRLRGMGLNIPQVLELAIKLKEAGYDVRTDVITIEEVRTEIKRCLLEKGGSTNA